MNKISHLLLVLSLCLLYWSPEAGAVGGDGGHSFTIQCTGSERLMAVITNAGKRIDGVGIVCIDRNGRQRQQWAGTSDTRGSSHLKTINITPARWINQVNIGIGKCGKKTTRVCSVVYIRDNGTSLGAGSRTSDTRAQRARVNEELFGFRGRAGREIDNLDALFRPRQRPAFTNSRRIPAQQIADAIDVLFSNRFELYLNNITSRRGNSWEDRDASYVRVAGVTRRIPIREFGYRRPKGKRLYLYYVQDVNARAARIDFDRGRGALVMRILMESDGVEMKGKCRYKRAGGKYKACSGKHEGDGKAPDVQWSYPEIELTMIPQVVPRGSRRNGVGLRVENVRLMGDFKLNGLCGKLASECHTILNGWKGRLITGVEGGVGGEMNSRDIQRTMADATRRLLNAASIPSIVDVVVDGNDVELRW